jgi:hypothetical protein
MLFFASIRVSIPKLMLLTSTWPFSLWHGLFPLAIEALRVTTQFELNRSREAEFRKGRALANAKGIGGNNAERSFGLSRVFLATDQARWKSPRHWIN